MVRDVQSPDKIRLEQASVEPAANIVLHGRCHCGKLTKLRIFPLIGVAKCLPPF